MESGGLIPPLPGAAKRPVKIRISRLVKRFRTLIAIDNVSVDIEEGSFFAIVGPSGCGKTTLLRILGGLETLTSGEVEIGRPSAGRPHYSMVFQGDSIFPWMTVWDNAAYGLRMRKAPKAQIQEAVSHWLARTGLTRYSRLYPHQLSGGMRQRVAIIRSLANEPDVLLMDEPFGALDVQTRWQMQDFLIETKSMTGKTIVFVTHDIDEAVYVSDRIYIASPRPLRLRDPIDVPFSAEARQDSLRRDP